MQREWRGFMCYLGKSSKSFSSQTTHPVNSKSSRRNSPGEALHFGGNGVALRHPVPEIVEITDTQTHTHEV